MGLWVGVALVFRGGIPILPGLVLLLAVPAFFLYRNTRIEAERQFSSDNRPVPPTAAAPEPVVGV
jgi:hypothetical protein